MKIKSFLHLLNAGTDGQRKRSKATNPQTGIKLPKIYSLPRWSA
jgi:hypothetical protein